MKKALFGLLAAAIVAAPLAVGATAANAAIGDEIIQNGDFSISGPDGSLVGATTDFALAALGVQGNHYAGPGDPLTSWDEGTYVVATNPNDQHVLWVNQPSDNPKMIVNGFEADTDQTVWSQSNPGIVCAVGDQVQYDFSATVANILPLDAYNNGGANITVWINGVQVAAVDLTTNDPSNPVVLSGNTVPAADPVVLTIKNGSGVKIGNDFSLDDISLIQTTGCLSPTPVLFDITPTAPTCDAPGSLDTSVFPIVRDGYTLTVDRAFDGPGDYVITATADADHYFSGDGDLYVRSVTVTVGERLTEGCAPPAIGGRTIGFWTNKNGTAAQSAGNLWASVKATYPNATAGVTTFAQAQSVIKSATCSGTCLTMLQAQFFAAALNTVYITGYGAQYVSVPQPVATLLGIGTCVQVTTLLSAINAQWASIDTHDERAAVQSVLNTINQDVPLNPDQCTP